MERVDFEFEESDGVKSISSVFDHNALLTDKG